MTPSELLTTVMLSLFCSEEETFLELMKILDGGPLPENVYDDIDPYQCKPENLPGEIWYYVKSKGNANSSLGHWRKKGGDHKLYSNSSFTGWRTTYEYYGGQAPHEHKRPWIMHKYWMSESDLCENSMQKKETNSLCKVFLGDEPLQDQILKIDRPIIPIIPISETIDQNHQLVVSDTTLNDMASGSTRNSEMSEDDEMDCFSEGNFLEMNDLNSPSPSSSENSSCLSMSLEDDHDFDTMHVLQYIESCINRDMAPREAPCIRSSAPPKLRKEVMQEEGASESLVSISHPLTQENLKTESTVPGSGHSEPPNRSMGEASSSSHNNGEERDVDGEKKKIEGRRLSEGRRFQKSILASSQSLHLAFSHTYSMALSN